MVSEYRVGAVHVTEAHGSVFQMIGSMCCE